MRKAPTLKEKLAATLLQLNPDLREWAKTQSPAAIISLFECHHNVMVALDGTNHPTNLTMMLKADHKARFPTDVKVAAKTKRLTRKQEDFRARMLAKNEWPHVEVGFGMTKTGIRKWVSRPMPGTKASGIKMKFGGKSERR